MNKDKIPYAIEGILFAAGEPVKTAKLAAVLEIETEAVEEAIRLLNLFITIPLLYFESGYI